MTFIPSRIKSRTYLMIGATASLLLAACASGNVTNYDLDHRAQYWQRADASSSLYMRGPKAQQMLHKDIAGCVVELRELERLGSIRKQIPAETENGTAPDPNTPAGQLASYETPERDGHLRAEFLDYHDMEGCMEHKGWQRVKYVPYEVSKEARDVYVETIMDEKFQSKYGDEAKFTMQQEKDDYADLND